MRKGSSGFLPLRWAYSKLMADGFTASQPGKAYPTLEYEIVTIAGQDNGVGMPIYLPTLDRQRPSVWMPPKEEN